MNDELGKNVLIKRGVGSCLNKPLLNYTSKPLSTI